ncbi:MAG: hypothetical protein J5855_00380 [Mailhella sp.]|nr:hypothetical protein [Mailhella sp.]
MKTVLVKPCMAAFAGMLFSLWNIFGDTSALCVTEGCSLFTDFKIGAFSLWWLGVAGFALLIASAVLGLGKTGRFLAACGVLADSFLLLVMVFAAPCANCLIAGALLALAYYFYLRDPAEKGRSGMSPVLCLWLALFVVNAGAAASESLGPWALKVNGDGLASADAGVQIYFSPSCPACKKLVSAQGKAEGIAWYPVAENADDIWRVLDMKRKIEAGEGLYLALLSASSLDTGGRGIRDMLDPESLLMQFRLWRNSAHVLKGGSKRLPFVEFRGAPASMLPDGRQKGSAATDLTIGGFCSGEEPCE